MNLRDDDMFVHFRNALLLLGVFLVFIFAVLPFFSNNATLSTADLMSAFLNAMTWLFAVTIVSLVIGTLFYFKGGAIISWVSGITKSGYRRGKQMAKEEGFYLDAKTTATILMLIIAVVYWISPIDLFPQSPIDDGVVLVAALLFWVVLVLIPHEPKKRNKEKNEDEENGKTNA